MNQEDLKREWIELAPAWIRETREGENVMRIGLLDGPMLDACGNVEGLKVLDSGCGEGRFLRSNGSRQPKAWKEFLSLWS